MGASWIRQGSDLPSWSDALLRADADEEWVVVHRDYGTHKRVEIAFAMLLDAGIPAWLKFEPFAMRFNGVAQILWGDLAPIPILVPLSCREEACALLAAPFEDTDGVFAEAEAEIDALWDEPTWTARAPELFRIWVLFMLLTNYVLPMLSLAFAQA